jgi:monoamine oxidase
MRRTTFPKAEGWHTSLDSQGYLNGAVETGERAAAEIVSALGK